MRAGQLVSHYRTLELIGEGGMGEVWSAQDETLQRRVALKAIRAEHRLDEGSRQRFLREARVLSALDHPRICRIYDYVEGEEADYLVLELIEGRTLHDALGGGPLPPTQAVQIAAEIAEVLVAAHGVGVVHRDLKPGNVMKLDDGSIKVLDFGLAASGSHEDGAEAGERAEPSEQGERRTAEAAQSVASNVSFGSFRTEHGRVVGTLQYMSPEQARGDPVGTAGDMYSFGLLVRELFTGKPVVTTAGDFFELHERVRNGILTPVEGVPTELTRLVERCQSLAPAARPTAVEALEKLRHFQGRGRRLLRRGAIALGVLGIVASATKYTIDVQTQRDRATYFEGEAEDVLTFLLVDLYDKLAAIGRTDVLLDAGNRARVHFASKPTGERTERDLLNDALSLRQLGRVQRDRGELAAALASAEESVAAASRGAVADSRAGRAARAQAFNLLGDLWLDQGNVETASMKFGQALAIAGADDTDTLPSARVHALVKLAEVAYYSGDLDSVERHATTARELADRSLERGDDERAWRFLRSQASFWLGYRLFDLADLDGALAFFTQYLADARAMVAIDARDVRGQVELTYALSNVATIDLELGRFEEARERFLEVAAIWRRLSATDPENLDWQRELADNLSWLGENGLRYGDLSSCRSAFEEEHALREALVREDEANAEWKAQLAVCLFKLGVVERASGSESRARERFAQSTSTSRTLVDSDPLNVEWRRTLASTLDRSASIELDGGNVERAREFAEQSLALWERLLEEKPDSSTFVALEVAVRTLSAGVLIAQSEEDAARIALSEARARLDGMSDAISAAAHARLARGRLFVAYARLHASGSSLERKEFERELAEFSASLDASPDVRSTAMCARSYGLLGNVDEARRLAAPLLERGYREVHFVEQGVREGWIAPELVAR